MIHFCVVHWKNARWIGRQLRHIAAHTKAEYRVLCLHTDLDGPIPDDDRIGFCEETRIREHAVKLDILGHEACRDARSDDDILVFIDSDAFPVAPWEGSCLPQLDRHRLVAVQRLENLGDPQPHPCFCVTTVGFWRDLGGTWAKGHKWRNTHGKIVTDVGGNLAKHLNEEGVDWTPLLRSNTHDPHPLWFGVYGGIVYHHGAGSRGRLSRLDLEIVDRRLARAHPLRAQAGDLLARVPGGGRLLRPARRAVALDRQRAALVAVREAETAALSDRIETVADEGLLTPQVLDDILGEATRPPASPARAAPPAQENRT